MIGVRRSRNNATPEDEQRLITRLQCREPQALAELYDRYSGRVYSLIFRIVRNGAMAEDLVQETLIRAWNRAHAFDAERGSFVSWLLAVARNRAIDYLRSPDGKTTQVLFGLEMLEEPALYADLQRNVLNMDRVRMLRESFAKLNPYQRTVIELAYFEGLSQTEIAARMQRPLGTVKTWMRSALRELREQLGTPEVSA